MCFYQPERAPWLWDMHELHLCPAVSVLCYLQAVSRRQHRILWPLPRCWSSAAQLLLWDDAVVTPQEVIPFYQTACRSFLTRHCEPFCVRSCPNELDLLHRLIWDGASGKQSDGGSPSKKKQNNTKKNPRVIGWTSVRHIQNVFIFRSTANWASWLQPQASCWCVTTPWWAALLCGF